MASGKTSKAVRNARASVVVKKPTPWGTIAAVVAIVLFGGAVFGYVYVKWDAKQELEAALAAYTPSESNQDPSDKIDGVEKIDYSQSRGHVDATQRVAYDQLPPFGGPHDSVWAACNGVVYSQPVRNENMVHPLEHGAVWIAYNPDRITGSALDTLKAKVENQQYIMMSPYPDLDKPISLQSWGHRLKLDSADDERIDQFIRALRTNPYQHPEVGGTCDAQPGTWNVDAPSPFVNTEYPPDAVPMTGGTPPEGSGEPAESGATAPPATTAPSGEAAPSSGAPAASTQPTG
ncbi:MAG TPA: DUF3105 domain-containing protein [Pseudonocardiaceae bacterium]